MLSRAVGQPLTAFTSMPQWTSVCCMLWAATHSPSSMSRSSSSSRCTLNTRVPLVADRLTSRPLAVPAAVWWAAECQ